VNTEHLPPKLLKTTERCYVRTFYTRQQNIDRPNGAFCDGPPCHNSGCGNDFRVAHLWQLKLVYESCPHALREPVFPLSRLGDFSIRAVSVYGVCLPLPFHHLVGSSVGQKTSRGQRPTEHPHILDFPAAQVIPLQSLAGGQRP
jgi:hypothetical protein